MRKLIDKLQEAVNAKIGQLDEKEEMSEQQEELYGALENLNEALDQVVDALGG